MLLNQLYLRVGILLTCGKALHGSVISLRGKLGPIKVIKHHFLIKYMRVFIAFTK